MYFHVSALWWDVLLCVCIMVVFFACCLLSEWLYFSSSSLLLFLFLSLSNQNFLRNHLSNLILFHIALVLDHEVIYHHMIAEVIDRHQLR